MGGFDSGDGAQGQRPSGARAAVSPRAESRRHAGITYPPLPGWREEIQGDLVVLRPVSPVPGYPIQVMLLPALPARAPLEEAAATVWNSVSTRLGTTLTRQVSGLPYMDDGRQTSFASHRYVHFRESLRTPGSSSPRGERSPPQLVLSSNHDTLDRLR